MHPREPPQSSPPSRSQQRHSSAPPPNIMMHPGSFPATMPNRITSSLINPNSSTMLMDPATGRFQFPTFASHSRSTPPPAPPFPLPPSNPSEPLRTTTSPYEGPSSGIDAPKKKRGRPSNYSWDGSTDLVLGPTPLSSIPPADLDPPSDEPPAKRGRGRPPGSGKKQLDDLGDGGTFFTPHVILVNIGEDLAAKITSFGENGARVVCILSAHGAVSNVTLRQPATCGGTVHYEGRYEILSLSGSFNPSGEGGPRTGGITVALAGTDGKLVGGRVSGRLVAASEIQVIVFSFIEKKKKSSPKEQSGPPPPAPGTQVLNSGSSSVTLTDDKSQGASSISSDENDDSSLQRGSASASGPGFDGSGSQPIQNMQWKQIWRTPR